MHELTEARLALHYMQTLVDVARESFLILNSDLLVLSANPTFYQNFQVTPKQTENKFIHKLGNGQWNIPKLMDLLKKILPEKKVIKNYEVAHNFETIGPKTILLNAKQIDSVQLIVLAMEDITERKKLEEKLAKHAEELEKKIIVRTKELADRVKELESINKSMVGRELKMVQLKKDIESCERQVKGGNGKNGNGKNGKGNHKNGQ